MLQARVSSVFFFCFRFRSASLHCTKAVLWGTAYQERASFRRSEGMDVRCRCILNTLQFFFSVSSIPRADGMSTAAQTKGIAATVHFLHKGLTGVSPHMLLPPKDQIILYFQECIRFVYLGPSLRCCGTR